MTHIRCNRLLSLIVVIITLIVFLTLPACTKQKEKELEPIKIGAILLLTGNLAFTGEHFKNGLSIAFEEMAPENMKIIYEDSKGQPKEAVTITNRLLMDDKVKIIVSNLSAVTNAIIPIIVNMEKPIVMMASLTSMSDVTAGSPYIFRYFLSSQDEVRRMTSYFKQKAIDKIGVLYLNDDFGKDAFHLLKKLFTGQILHEDTYTPLDKDFKSITAKVKDLDHLYIIGYGPTYGLLVKQLREFGYKGKIYAYSSLSSPVVLNIAGDTAKGVIFTGTTFNPKSPSTNKENNFVKLYERKYNKLPDHYAAYGYDIGIILAKISKTEAASSEQIKNEILSLRDFSGVFGKTTIDDSGDFHFDVKLYQVLQDGTIGSVQ